MTSFTLHLPEFDGPLDLLLQLIEREELDITMVSLAQVADHYLAHVRTLDAIDPHDLADFIAVAAKLLLIKSAVLLPRPERPPAEEAIDPTDLTERLRAYQAFKQAARALQEREEAGLRSYGRLAPLAPPPARLRPKGGVPADLMKALERLAAEIARRPQEDTVERERFTIGQKVELLRERCGAGGAVTLRALLEGCGRAEAVATFLALLELLRLGEVDATQDQRYGDIVIAAAAKSERAGYVQLQQ